MGYARPRKMVMLLLPPSALEVNMGFRDAWAKHKDLDPYEAKWLYVEALVKVCFSFVTSERTSLTIFSQVLRKYSDKTIAKSLIEELESYGGDASHIVRSRKYWSPFLIFCSLTSNDRRDPFSFAWIRLIWFHSL